MALQQDIVVDARCTWCDKEWESMSMDDLVVEVSDHACKEAE